MTDTPNLNIRSSTVWSAEGKSASKQTKRGKFDNGITREVSRRQVNAEVQRQRDEIKRSRGTRSYRKYVSGTSV